MNPFATAVFGSGRIPNPIMLVGEAPGAEEYRKGRPFIGASGDEQEWYLQPYNLSARWWYQTNVCKTYLPGNPDPTPDLISFWTPFLEDEIRECQPKLVIAVGRFAANWFLGNSLPMETLHNVPHIVTISGITFVVLPIYHPAFGLHNDEMKGQIAWDYSRVAEIVSDVNRLSRESLIRKYSKLQPKDSHLGRESYIELSGPDFIDAITPYEDSILGAPLELAIDTEGWIDYPWPQWTQITPEPGISYILKSSKKHFSIAIKRLQFYVNRGTTIIAHQASTPSCAMIETVICRILGLELRDAILDDTMYAAYLLRVISRGLKPLGYRYAGMLMEEYEDIIGEIGRQKQIDYIRRACKINWPKPEPFIERQSDGTYKQKSPKSINALLDGLLRDLDNSKRLKDGSLVDPAKRFYDKSWKKIRRTVESKMGVFPRGTLDDIDPKTANRYAGRDSDATFRIKPRILSDLDSLGLLPIYRQAMRYLPIIEDMQREGMPARRSSFDKLQSHIIRERSKMQREINSIVGYPINVNSPKQMIPALRRLHITPRKKTKSGAPSIGKKSLEFAKHSSRFVQLSFWIKEHGKIDSTYVRPALSIADRVGATEEFTVNSIFKPATVTSRRLSTEKPSLLNQPTRTAIGRMVRDCYVAPPGQIFGAWDFKAQELRVAVSISRDPFGIQVFTKCALCGTELPTKKKCRKSKDGNHGDPHTQAAARIFGIPYDEVKKFEHRLPAKTATFGVINGLSGPGLVDQFLMYIPPNQDGSHPWSKEEECQRLINEILGKVYKGIGEEIKRTAEHLRKYGQVRDIFADNQPGMIRYLPNGRSVSERLRAEAIRQAFNHRVQGTAAQMTQSSATWIDAQIRRMQRRGIPVHWRLIVHDEFILSFAPDLWDEIDAIVLEGMTQNYGVELCVPVEADGESAGSWGELKKD